MLKIKDKIGFNMNRKRGIIETLEPKGLYFAEHHRRGRIIDAYPVPNLITNEGKNKLWDVMFHDATQIAASSWFMGLVSAASYSAIAVTNTMASHGTWLEYTAYDQATRPAWGPGASSAQTITNASPVVFDFNATGTLKGIFIASNSTKSGTTGVLWSVGLFASNVDVVDEDQIKLTYAASL